MGTTTRTTAEPEAIRHRIFRLRARLAWYRRRFESLASPAARAECRAEIAWTESELARLTAPPGGDESEPWEEELEAEVCWLLKNPAEYERRRERARRIGGGS